MLLHTESHHVNITYSVLSFLFCISVLLLVLLFKSKARRRKKQFIIYKLQQELIGKKKQLEEFKLLLANAEEELDSANLLIQNSKKEVVSKQKELDEIEEHIAKDISDRIQNLKNTKILTSDDWLLFRKAFNNLYPNYISTIEQIFPNITRAEIRLLALSKLGLSHNKIAEIQGISAHASRVTWSRFQQKYPDIVDGRGIKEFCKYIDTKDEKNKASSYVSTSPDYTSLLGGDIGSA